MVRRSSLGFQNSLVISTGYSGLVAMNRDAIPKGKRSLARTFWYPISLIIDL